jgi:hypothetical protein
VTVAPGNERAHQAELTVGLVGTAGVSEETLGRLCSDLVRDLRQHLPGAVWSIGTELEQRLAPPADLDDLLDCARRHLLATDRQLVLLLTELPLNVGRRPLLSHVSPSQGVAVVSLPGHGALALKSRTRRSLLRAVQVLVGSAAPEDSDRDQPRRGHRSRADVDRRMHELATAVSPEQGGVTFAAQVITGNLHLLAGMVRANQPWRLVLRLARSLSAALAAAVAALVTQDIWRLSEAMGAPRLAVATVGSIASVCVALIAGAHLWERYPRRSARQQVLLLNAATTATVVLGVMALYVMLFSLTVVGVLLLVPDDLFASALGRPLGLGDQVRLAWLVSSVATLAGALGAGLESDEAVRAAAYAHLRRTDQSM